MKTVLLSLLTRYLFIAIGIFMISPAVSAETFSYPNFSATNGLYLNSDAGASNAVLRLTPSAPDRKGAAWRAEKVSCSEGFVSEFQFQISALGGSGGGDGISFCIQSEGLNADAYEYCPSNNGLGISFNTYFNPGLEVSGNFVGVCSNGPIWLAQQNLSLATLNLSDGNVHSVRVAYNGTALNVTIDNINVITNFPVSLAHVLDANGKAWVGFGARTGGAWENHDILNWSFNSPGGGGVGPAIVTQPQSRTVTAGTNVTFAVVANGTSPLSYRWRLNGTNIAGASGASLMLSNVQPHNAGSYSVVVTNLYGSITSSNAILIVNSVTNCLQKPSGLVSWWPGEQKGTIRDNVDGNNGVGLLGLTTEPAKVGSGLSFPSSQGHVKVPASSNLNVGTGPGFTIDAWIKPSSFATQRPLVEWNTGNTYGAHLWISVPGVAGTGPGSLYANIRDLNFQDHIITTGPGVINTNEFQHVALTYNKTSGVAALYVNGLLVTNKNLGTFTPMTTGDLYFGFRPAGDPAGARYSGVMDEIDLFNRALSLGEVQAIYNAGALGKCKVLPTIITNLPPRVSVNEGSTATFKVSAIGDGTLYYQWRFNNQSITGATNSLLTLSNVTYAMRGNYSVLVENAVGSVLSSNSELIVNRFPVAQGQSVTTDEDTPKAIVLVASDPDGTPLTYTVNSPTNGVLSGTAPNLTYTPSANFNGGDSFTFRVNDGMVNSALATVSITVLSVNDLPTAIPQTVLVNEDSSVAITLSAADPDGDLLSYVVTTTPGHGTLTGTAPSLVYTPNTNYFGSDSFKFTVSDGVGSSEATVTINVASVNDLPNAEIKVSPLAKFAGITNLIVISGNGSNALVVLDGSASSDADGDALQYAWHYGTNAPFAFDVLTTNWFDVGTLDMNLTVTDGIDSDTASVTIEIITASDAIGILVELLEGSNAKTKPLIVSLASAAASFERGNEQAGCNQLEAFKNKVEAQVKDAITAEWLIKAADEILKVFKAPKSVKMPALHLERNEEPVFQITE